MTARDPAIVMPSSRNVAWAQSTTPDEVAPTWPAIPPMAIGLPVTTPGVTLPRIIETVSMIQDIIRASVFTSGAGTSRSGPRSEAMSKA